MVSDSQCQEEWCSTCTLVCSQSVPGFMCEVSAWISVWSQCLDIWMKSVPGYLYVVSAWISVWSQRLDICVKSVPEYQYEVSAWISPWSQCLDVSRSQAGSISIAVKKLNINPLSFVHNNILSFLYSKLDLWCNTTVYICYFAPGKQTELICLLCWRQKRLENMKKKNIHRKT